MAIARGKESTEGGSLRRYIGVGSVYVKAICPTKAQLEELFGRDQEKDPSYTGEIDINGQKVPFVRVEWIVKTDPEKNNGIETTQRMSFLLRNEPTTNKDGNKYQVIDIYGRTAWATEEEINAHSTTLTKNDGSKYEAQISKDYRIAYVGEEILTDAVRAYLNIPTATKFVEGKPVGLIDNASDAECRLECIDKYFKGDFSELQELLSFQPNNKIKVLFGIQTTDDNKQYQKFFNELVLKNSVSDFSKLSAKVEDAKARGKYPTTEFEVCPLREFNTTVAPSPEPAEAPKSIPSAWLKK